MSMKRCSPLCSSGLSQSMALVVSNGKYAPQGRAEGSITASVPRLGSESAILREELEELRDGHGVTECGGPLRDEQIECCLGSLGDGRLNHRHHTTDTFALIINFCLS